MGALSGVQMGSSIGPLSQRRLDEALGLAVGARGVRLCADVRRLSMRLRSHADCELRPFRPAKLS